MEAFDRLQEGRTSYARRMWLDAFKAYSRADEAAPLEADDLWSLAMSAYLIGRDHDFARTMGRAHHAHLEADRALPAARCAFWIGFTLANRGEIGPATGWFARAERLVEQEERDCVERGYLLLPLAMQQAFGGEAVALFATAGDAGGIGVRFGEPDLIAFALHLQGRALVMQGRVDDGLMMLDEAMVAVTTGELSPMVTGIIYCSVIEACQEVYALRRAHEWTAALTRWCEGQPDLVPYAGQCLVHRAEILALQGAWSDALQEAQGAAERFARGVDQMAGAAAFYQQAEVHRVLGDFAAAEDAYRRASHWGWEPQPGLALLRLAQGDTDAAAAAIRRVVAETTDPLVRARLLPAYVEIMLATSDVREARSACIELGDIAKRYGTDVLGAIAARATGAVELADGHAQAALASLRHAGHVWRRIEAPYEVARVRVLVGSACRALGDHDTAAMELSAARGLFEQLGAAPDLAHADSIARDAATTHAHGLTAREVQVLHLVAAGKTNKAIASDLFISEKTVDRHVSNILTKLNVASRAAATAYAYEHQLI